MKQAGMGGRLVNGLRTRYSGIKFMKVTTDTSLVFNSSEPFSLSMWLQPIAPIGNGSGNAFLFTKIDANGKGYQFLIGVSGGVYTLYFSRYTANYSHIQQINCVIPNPYGKIQHFCGRMVDNTATGMQLWQNGVLLAGTASSSLSVGEDITVLNKPCVGMYQDASPDGVCDAIFLGLKVYKRALSAAEFGLLYQRENAVYLPNCVADWRFWEKKGKTVKDYSNNGADGTLINYTDAETANAGQPQSGNTAWVNAYSLLPITP